MKTEKNQDKAVPVAAPGDDEYLDKKATTKERKSGNYTRVARLSLDEVDPS